MADQEARTLTLYLQSKKAVTGFFRPPASAIEVGVSPEAAVRDLAGSSRPDEPVASEEAFFLSDDQAHAAALAEELAGRRGYELKVVDVARTGRFERLLVERIPSNARFPLLLGPHGQRLEGPESFTEERLCEVMPAELVARRAFTYLKVRGGDLERIRLTLLGLPEVRELHFLTGDWDLIAVLEFPEAERPKRRVLDFVTSRIRSIPDVLDTSTLVPEFSVTKFPV